MARGIHSNVAEPSQRGFQVNQKKLNAPVFYDFFRHLKAEKFTDKQLVVGLIREVRFLLWNGRLKHSNFFQLFPVLQEIAGVVKNGDMMEKLIRCLRYMVRFLGSEHGAELLPAFAQVCEYDYYKNNLFFGALIFIVLWFFWFRFSLNIEMPSWFVVVHGSFRDSATFVDNLPRQRLGRSVRG